MHYREGHPIEWSLFIIQYQSLAAFLIRSRGDNSLQYDDDFLKIVCWIYLCVLIIKDSRTVGGTLNKVVPVELKNWNNNCYIFASPPPFFWLCIILCLILIVFLSLPCTTPEPCKVVVVLSHSDVNWHFRSLVNIISISGKQGTLMPEAWHRVRFCQMSSLNYTSY